MKNKKITPIRIYYAVLLFFKIVWREWDCIEVEKDKWVTYRIGWSTAWTVSKGIWFT